ncbi:hypothetical protein SAMN05444172_4619 [Burkholderia sp. GAS332]|jgi:hypothetical protein|nr:hypothetical protein SAMN05444172_4619 [Burkholderia sp. GAS332]
MRHQMAFGGGAISPQVARHMQTFGGGAISPEVAKHIHSKHERTTGAEPSPRRSRVAVQPVAKK